MNVGDMPTASWIKKMSSNWILPFFYLRFLLILMEGIKCEHQNEKGSVASL